MPTPKKSPTEAITLPILQIPQGLPDFKYAITLHRPWPYAIAHLGKDIENRTKALGCVQVGEYLAIHAARGYNFPAEDWIKDRFPKANLPEITEHPTGIIALAEFRGNVTQSNSVWFEGPVGWQLGKVLRLSTPVDCPGQQGLWIPSDEIKQQVFTALKVPF